MKVYIPIIPTRFDRVAGCRVPTVDMRSIYRFDPDDVVEVCPRDTIVCERTIPEIQDVIRDVMTDWTPDDLLVCVGEQLLFALAFAEASEHGPVNVLFWNRNTKAYDKIKVTL